MKKRKLQWTRAAKADLQGIKGYIAQYAPRVGASYIRRIRERCQKITALPFAAPVVEEFQNEHIRETYYGSYRIIYEVGEETVVVLRVIHGARLLDERDFSESNE